MKNTIFDQIFKKIGDLLYPLRCPICDRPVKKEDGLICEDCEKKVEFVQGFYCMRCGKALFQNEEYCKDCKGQSHVFTRGRAVFSYVCIAKSIYRFKYKGRKEYAAYYGRCIKELLGDFIRQVRPDGIIPIPLHKKREKMRGYNQAKLLAEALSMQVGIPVLQDAVIRVKNTVPQKELNEKQRQNNMKKAFQVVSNDVKLKTIILIDDIYTTGSTMDALAEVLLEAGAGKIYFITLAIGSMG